MASVMRTCLRLSGVGPLAVLVLSLAGWSANGYALGLGEIRLSSNLNERLVAEIPLNDLRGLEAEEIRVSLGSNADFERLGVERFFFLGDLRFQVEIDRSGTGRIRVTSERPIAEPYLNFLVQVLWPQGRLLKEYTLLLDPPTFSQAAAPVVRPAEQAVAPARTAGTIERPGTRVEMAPVSGRAPTASPLDAGIVGGEYRMTDRTDTLWSIAQRARPSSGVSVQQTMLAIQRRNPTAFINDNINLLKAGVTLQLPTEDEIRALSQSEALEQVALQTRAWRGEAVVAERPPADVAPGPAAIDATPAPAAAPAAADTAEGRLRIVAGAGDSASAPVAPEATPEAGAPQLAAAMEEQDRLTREVSDLTSQLDREKELAANQIAVKDRLLEVKDQQIAEMEAELARLRESGATAQSQDQNARPDVSAWWQSPLFMGLGAGVVVLLLAAVLVAARRRRADMPFPAPSRASAAAQPSVPGRAAARASDVRAAVPAPVAAPAMRAPAAELAGSELADVIAEADVYLTYARHGQAAGLLQSALEADPGRHDVRLKLLEVLAAAGDRDGFDAELAALRARTTEPTILETASTLAAGFGTAPAPVAGRAGSDTLDYELELFPDQGGTATPDQVEGAPDRRTTGSASAPAVAAAADLPDLNIDLDDLPDSAAAPRATNAADDDTRSDLLGGDLGIDFKLDDETFRLEADDLEALDDDALAREMDGLPAEEDAFEFADETDSASTKLDLARAYKEMGDAEGAREILLEVLKEGSGEQQRAAQELLDRL